MAFMEIAVRLLLAFWGCSVPRVQRPQQSGFALKSGGHAPKVILTQRQSIVDRLRYMKKGPLVRPTSARNALPEKIRR